jgi:hypothetical protein
MCGASQKIGIKRKEKEECEEIRLTKRYLKGIVHIIALNCRNAVYTKEHTRHKIFAHEQS